VSDAGENKERRYRRSPFRRQAERKREKDRRKRTSLERVSMFTTIGHNQNLWHLTKKRARDLRHIGVPLPCRHYRRHQPLFLRQRSVRLGSTVSLLAQAERLDVPFSRADSKEIHVGGTKYALSKSFTTVALQNGSFTADTFHYLERSMEISELENI